MNPISVLCFIAEAGAVFSDLLQIFASEQSTRLPSDSGAFADWVANPSSSSALRPSDQDLSLGFNAGGGGTGTSTATAGMWSSSSTSAARQINYGVPEIGMLGLRDVFLVADNHAHHPHSMNASIANANAATALGVGVGVIPLLTATPCLAMDENTFGIRTASGSGGGRGNTNNNSSSNYNIQFWQEHPQTQPQHPPHNYLNKPMIDHGFGGGGSSSTSGSTMTCQDCGNQAKKDCTHRRCRTCCKSRGFDCATHVKSTWVPAARRRERQLMTSTGAASVSSASTSGPKKPRLTSHTTTTSHTSTSNTTPPRSFDTSSSHHKQDASFKESLPGQVRAPAVFKCVRVTAVDDGDDEYAYQASATIGGHLFKGFLYDQGVETRDHTNFPNFSELHLGGTGGSRNVGGSSSSQLLDTPDVFASSGGGLLTGSTYGNPIN
ncbi:hypothetical protein E3N88_43094 [Mikania micrantha]|uniref:Uncharacterized protein n=1 Tax=Mikania micrantha TaxID=192012 RepID=A0A5N6LFX2_9ASTR|nr:hypothetical protein E3N88_43094 [Mikania micrantha]